MKNKKFNKEKGITLVAIVITIIILLILAGISISKLTGDGILKRSKQAKDEYEISTAQELLNVQLMNILSDNNGNKDLNNLDGMIVKGYDVQVSDIGKIVTMTKNGISYYFLVDSDYRIQDLNNNLENNQGSGGGQTNTSGVSNSKIINDFEVVVSKKTPKSLTIDTKSEITTKNETTVKGYMIFLQGKVIGVTDTLPYKILGLERNTSYSGICVQAIDEDGNTKKSKNIIDNESTLNDMIELVPDDYVASSVWSSTGPYPASKAFDGSETGKDYWHAKDTSKPQYCGAKFNNKVYVEKFYLNCYYQSKDIVLQASDDGVNWVDIQSYTCSEKKDTYEVTNKYDKEYNYYCIKTTNSNTYVAYYEIKFYGF